MTTKPTVDPGRAAAAGRPRRGRWRTAALGLSATALLSGVTLTGLAMPSAVAAATTPFDCGSGAPGLLFQQTPTTINSIDLVTGENTQNVNVHPNNINAVGYNVLDNFIYGIDWVTQQIMRVDQNGEITALPKPAQLPDTSGTIIGDVGPDGHYWVAHTGRQEWFKIDLIPGSSTYGRVVDSGALTNPAGYNGGADWAYVPGQGNYLFRPAARIADGTGAVLRFDMATGQQTVWMDFPDAALGGSGAVYASPGGFLYASMNNNGDIWRLDIPGRTGALFAGGPASGSNDGARCADSPIELDFGDAPDSYGTTLAADGPRHSLVNYDNDTELANLMLGGNVEQEPDGVPGAAADGDGRDDGVTEPIILTDSQQTTVSVQATNNTSRVATLAGWIDLNDNGTFEAGERVTLSVPASSGTDTYELTFPAPGAISGSTYARFRLFPGNVADPSPVGPASNGEVEDYVVLKPSLAVAKVSDATAATRIGDVVNYAVTVTNTGSAAYTAANPARAEDDLTDVLDDAFWLGTQSTNTGTVSWSSPTLTWEGPLDPGASATFNYSVRVTAAGDQRMRNVAYTCIGEDCAPVPPAECVDGINPATGQACTVVTHDLPRLELEKSAPDLATAQVGDVVTYQVIARNVGRGDFTAADPARFVDDLSGVLDDADWLDEVTAGSGTTGFTEPALSWSGALAAGADVTVTYQVRLTGRGDNRIDNVVFETPACADGGIDCPVPPTPACDPSGVADSGLAIDCVSAEKPRLEISKQADGAGTARVGDTVTYTVTATNTGAGDFTTANPATVIDDLTAVLDDADYNADATADAGVAPTYTAPQLVWSGALAAGDSVTLTYSVTLTGAGDGTVRNVAFQPGCTTAGCTEPPPAECVDGVTDEGRACDAVSFDLPELEIEKAAANLATARIGDDVTYTVTLTNTGPGDFTTARPAHLVDDLSAVLDDAEYNGDATATAGATPSFTDPVLTWSGPIASGQSVTITYSVRLTLAGDTSVENIAFEPPCDPADGACEPVTPPAPDCVDNEFEGRACDVVTAELPKLTITKTSADLATAKIGDTVSFAVTFENVGTGDFSAVNPAYGVDDMTDLLDDAVYNDDASVTTGTVAWREPQLQWSGPLGAGETAELTYSVTLTGDGDRSLRNVAFETGCDPADADCDSTPPATCVDGVNPATGLACDEQGRDFGRLISTKTLDAPKPVKDGSTLTYTLTIKNTGAADYTAENPAKVVDNMAGVLDDARYNRDATASAGRVAYQRPELTWTGPLAAGATVTVTYSVVVDTAKDGDGSVRNIVVTHDPLDPTGSVPDDGGDQCATAPEENRDAYCAVETNVEEDPAPEDPDRPDLPDTGSSMSRGLLVGALGTGLLLLGGGAAMIARNRRRIA